MAHDPKSMWSDMDSEAAAAEGWNVFWSDAYGPEIEKVDEADVFEDDRQADTHVRRRAACGSALHLRALRYLGACLMQWAEDADADRVEAGRVYHAQGKGA